MLRPKKNRRLSPREIARRNGDSPVIDGVKISLSNGRGRVREWLQRAFKEQVVRECVRQAAANQETPSSTPPAQSKSSGPNLSRRKALAILGVGGVGAVIAGAMTLSSRGCNDSAPVAPQAPENKEKTDPNRRFTEAVLDMQKLLAPKKENQGKRAYLDSETLTIVCYFNPPEKDEKTNMNAWHDANRARMPELIQEGHIPYTTVDQEKDWPIAQVVSQEHELANKVTKALSPHPNGETPFAEAVSNFRGTLELGAMYEYFKKASGTEAPDAVFNHFLALCIYGQITTESGWNYDAVSDKDARGPFQITPATAKDVTRKFKGTEIEEALSDVIDLDNYNLHDLPESNIVAALYYERAFLRLKDDFEKVKKSFKFESDKSFAKDFVIPCLINSYHSGISHIERMIKFFLEKHTNDINVAQYVKDNIGEGPYGKDLYFTMSYFFYLNEANNGKCRENGGCYGRESRLYFIKCYANAQLFAKEKERQEQKGEKEAEDENLAVNFEAAMLKGSYTFIEDNGLRDKIGFKRLKYNAEDHRTLDHPKNNLRNTVDWLASRGFSRYRANNNGEITDMRKRTGKETKDLQVSDSMAYRCSPSNMRDPERRFALKETVDDLLPELTLRVNEYLWEKGCLSRRFLVRPILNSTFRTRTAQERAGGHYLSGHEMAAALDIGVKAFDVIDLASKKGDSFKYTTVWNQKPIRSTNGADLKEGHAVDKALMRVLAQMVEEGKVFAKREYGIPHFHIIHKAEKHIAGGR